MVGGLIEEIDMEILSKFKCCECGDIHDDRDDALECCPPEIVELWQCPDCESLHNEEDSAEKCCGHNVVRCPVCARDHGMKSVDATAINVAGHCRTCTPLYTYDEQDQINTQHYELTGESARIFS